MTRPQPSQVKVGAVVQAKYQNDCLGHQAIRTLMPSAVIIHPVFGPDGQGIAEYSEATGALIRQNFWSSRRLDFCSYFCPIRGSVPARKRSILGRCL